MRYPCWRCSKPEKNTVSGNFDQFVTDFDRFVYGFRSISVFDFYGFRHYYTWSIRGNHGIRIQYVYTCDLFTYIPTQDVKPEGYARFKQIDFFHFSGLFTLGDN